MKNILISKNNVFSYTLLFFFVFYTFLSWFTMFRDPRAVLGIGLFYPHISSLLWKTRVYLEHYGLNTLPTLLLLFFIIFSFLIYFLSLKRKFTLKKIILFALLFQSVVFISFPILSTDIFYYMFTDRNAVVHNSNVWTTSPAVYASDKFAYLSDWHDTKKVYGGVNQLFYSIGTSISGKDFFTNLYVHKAVVWLFVIATMVLIIKILPTNSKRETALQIIFWNPLFVIETVGSGHNDILMLFFMLVAYYFYQQKRFIVSGIIFAFATQVKISPLLFLPFLLFELIYRKKFKEVIYFVISFLIVNAVIYIFMQVSPLQFIGNVSHSTNLYWQSFPSFIHRVYAKEQLFILVSIVILFISGLYIQWTKKVEIVTIYCSVLLIYLLLLVNAYWNWYVLWLLVFVPFINSPKLKNAILAFTLSSSLAYVIYGISLRYNYKNIWWSIASYIVIISLPLALVLYNRFTIYLKRTV